MQTFNHSNHSRCLILKQKIACFVANSPQTNQPYKTWLLEHPSPAPEPSITHYISTRSRSKRFPAGTRNLFGTPESFARWGRENIPQQEVKWSKSKTKGSQLRCTLKLQLYTSAVLPLHLLSPQKRFRRCHPAVQEIRKRFIPMFECKQKAIENKQKKTTWTAAKNK